MRRFPKVKSAPGRLALRKAVLTAPAAARRAYPAWIDAEDRAVPVPAVAVTPRVRTALVLRQVATRKSTGAKGSTDANGAR
jgi:hypothetical protein